MRYVAFLRALNVAGHARVAMADVCTLFEKAGCRGAKSVGHAGNLLWTQPAGKAPEEQLRAALRRLLGQAPEIMVRTARDMRRIVEANPFDALASDKAVKLYVVFLARQPKQMPPLPVRLEKEALELVAVTGREAYVISRKKPGTVMYGFPNQFVERALGVPATSRNWNTVVKIAGMVKTRG
jgi:uncharacterized protein (DUF1697 family)